MSVRRPREERRRRVVPRGDQSDFWHLRQKGGREEEGEDEGPKSPHAFLFLSLSPVANSQRCVRFVSLACLVSKTCLPQGINGGGGEGRWKKKKKRIRREELIECLEVKAALLSSLPPSLVLWRRRKRGEAVFKRRESARSPLPLPLLPLSLLPLFLPLLFRPRPCHLKGKEEMLSRWRRESKLSTAAVKFSFERKEEGGTRPKRRKAKNNFQWEEAPPSTDSVKEREGMA